MMAEKPAPYRSAEQSVTDPSTATAIAKVEEQGFTRTSPSNAVNASTSSSMADSQPPQEIRAAWPWLPQLFFDSTGWLVSIIVHTLIFMLLAIWIIPPEIKQIYAELDATIDRPQSEIIEPAALQPENSALDPEVKLQAQAEIDLQPTAEAIQENLKYALTEDLPAAMAVELDPLGSETAPKGDLLKDVGSVLGNSLSGRGSAERGALVRRGGGTAQSEQAVDRALKWLAEHQNSDGSWSFEHHLSRCQGRCPDHGSLRQGSNGATGLALLPFLGSGQTHKVGKYRRTVKSGLYYLLRSMQVSADGGDLRDGGWLYSHGIASIALCEAYAMTKDKKLMKPAQLALDFITSAQDPTGGGWRYMPQQGGDTSVVGWQIMALKSGYLAYLEVPAQTVLKASKFLDSVQSDRGARYGYVPSQVDVDPKILAMADSTMHNAATTAIGLLCRMHLGWKQDHEALKRGVTQLSEWGPSSSDLYYNYYATQVLFQYTGGQGVLWNKWNHQLRDQLTKSQSRDGHSRGSWFVSGDHGSNSGGRLYCTAMSTMILEVYYRHMPLYREGSISAEFPE